MATLWDCSQETADASTHQTLDAGAYDTIMVPEVRLHADYWQRTKQLHPAILEADAPKPDDMQGSVVRISKVWWRCTKVS